MKGDYFMIAQVPFFIEYKRYKNLRYENGEFPVPEKSSMVLEGIEVNARFKDIKIMDETDITFGYKIRNLELEESIFVYPPKFRHIREHYHKNGTTEVKFYSKFIDEEQKNKYLKKINEYFGIIETGKLPKMIPVEKAIKILPDFLREGKTLFTHEKDNRMKVTFDGKDQWKTKICIQLDDDGTYVFSIIPGPANEAKYVTENEREEMIKKTKTEDLFLLIKTIKEKIEKNRLYFLI
jgi:hypothetical protein